MSSNSPRGPAFISELQSVIPNSDYGKRGTYDLKKYHGNPTSHEPELSLFPQEPNFRGRRVINIPQPAWLYNLQTSSIKESKQSGTKGKDGVSQERVKARLQQCGPSFTLKLVTLQHGTFDTKGGEFDRLIR
ncbi:unnamed protein product [Eruca vesicaria subsp. sativa]|uniref:Uncharacterized protein n=1 Tax=Eruca vesicaria subsp. sativa TaxID=29727 RepID=A0ABC8K4R6_ERUVS|nr:unnamed protein product [Eruca vesicaria subsp. sativa]